MSDYCPLCGNNCICPPVRKAVVQIEPLVNENASLRARLARAVEALEFYAEPKNWNMCWRDDIKQYVPANTEGSSVIEMKKWLEARACLASLKEDK